MLTEFSVPAVAPSPTEGNCTKHVIDNAREAPHQVIISLQRGDAWVGMTSQEFYEEVKAVAKGDTVTLVGFGTFKSSKRAARTGRNPQTGKEIKIAATTVPRFTAGATFKAAVAGKKAKKK